MTGKKLGVRMKNGMTGLCTPVTYEEEDKGKAQRCTGRLPLGTKRDANGSRHIPEPKERR